MFANAETTEASTDSDLWEIASAECVSILELLTMDVRGFDSHVALLRVKSLIGEKMARSFRPTTATVSQSPH